MNSEIRVMHVLPTLTGGGAENFVASLTPRLNGNGMVCSVMTIYPSEKPEDIPLLRAPQIIPIERRGRYDAAFFPRMVAAMRAWNPTVVHTHMHNGKYWGRLAARAAGVPVIVHTVHNPCDTARTMGEPIADRMLNAASSAIVTFSKQQRLFLAQFEGIPEEKVVVIPNGIAHRPLPVAGARERVRRGFRLGNEYAIFVVGRLQQQKNQRLAIEAMAELSPATREQFHLYILGAGEDRHMLIRLIEERGLERNVELFGYRPDVGEILPAADLVFMPSLTEGMPLVLLEAMSAGIPVLSTPWTGASDLLEEGRLGTLATDWEPASIARCFIEARNDATRLRALASMAQPYIRREYDIEITAQRHRELYQMLAMRKRAA